MEESSSLIQKINTLCSSLENRGYIKSNIAIFVRNIVILSPNNKALNYLYSILEQINKKHENI